MSAVMDTIDAVRRKAINSSRDASGGTLSSQWEAAISNPSTRGIPEKPSTSMLRHMAAPQLNADDSRQALAIAVEDKLGYTPLRKHAGAPSRLQRILQELEIEAFDQKSVDDYKLQMKAHFQAKANERDSIHNALLPIYMGHRFTSVGWRRSVLAGYSKPVPEFVLNKCLQIKERAPDAIFLVEELLEEARTLDPFLVVQIGDDMAAIEVWDEPEFEKAL